MNKHISYILAKLSPKEQQVIHLYGSIMHTTIAIIYKNKNNKYQINIFLYVTNYCNKK